MKNLLLKILLLLTPILSFSQKISDLKCGFEQDSISQQIKSQVLAKMNSMNATSSLSGVVTIPVVVHVIEPSTSSSLITDTQIQTMITELNNAYRATGSYAGGLDIEIQFQLAVTSPTCTSTNGITRYDASSNSLYVSKGVFGTGVTWGEVQSWRTWDKSLYANIWIVNKLDNGASGVGGASEGLIMLASSAIGISSGDNTAPHEFGHYFGLAHPFPSDTGTGCNCGDGDGLSDTPNLIPYGIGSSCSHLWGCSTANMNSTNPCTGSAYGNIQKNFMNYLSNGCGVLFTSQQKDYMRNVLETYHSSLLTSPMLQSPVSPEAKLTTTPTFCTASGYPNFKASCICSTIQGVTINGIAYPSNSFGGYKPILAMGQTATWTYVLTCANNLTNTKTVIFYNPGVTNIVKTCNSNGTYSITFSNPNNYTVNASVGTLSGTTVSNIPSGSDLLLTVTDVNGCGGTQTITKPCCNLPTTMCVPTAPNGIGPYFGIENFTFNGETSINFNSSSSQNDGFTYINNSCTQTATAVLGNSYTFSVKGYYTNSHFVKIYIDYNNNGLFTDSGELVASGSSGGGSPNTFTGTVVIPTTASINVPLKIRVLADVSSSSNACNIVGHSTFKSGQIEDYGLTITCAVPAAPTVSSVTINSGQTATLNTTGCANGTISWFDVATGGTALTTGATFTTPVLTNPPTSTKTYYAECTENSCTSATRGTGTVTVNSPCANLTYNLVSTINDIATGTHKFEAGLEITATNKLTGGNIIYDSGKSITMNPGFIAATGTVFLAHIDGCGNQ